MTKKEKYESIDKRLQCFIDEMTKKNGHRSTICDNTNYKYNVLENIMKSRNNNYVSQIGISENIICHFGSNKCKHNTQVLNKLGGKGHKQSIDTLINDSLTKMTFIPPDTQYLQITFDNVFNVCNLPTTTSY